MASQIYVHRDSIRAGTEGGVHYSCLVGAAWMTLGRKQALKRLEQTKAATSS